jgi:hypothetical protein
MKGKVTMDRQKTVLNTAKVRLSQQVAQLLACEDATKILGCTLLIRRTLESIRACAAALESTHLETGSDDDLFSLSNGDDYGPADGDDYDWLSHNKLE